MTCSVQCWCILLTDILDCAIYGRTPICWSTVNLATVYYWAGTVSCWWGYGGPVGRWLSAPFVPVTRNMRHRSPYNIWQSRIRPINSLRPYHKFRKVFTRKSSKRIETLPPPLLNTEVRPHKNNSKNEEQNVCPSEIRSQFLLENAISGSVTFPPSTQKIFT